MHNLTKSQKRKLRELAGLAHERDLAAELAALENKFRQWRVGEIDPFALSAAIHTFHDGTARDLHGKYNDGNPDFAVANAILRGILTEEEVDAEVMGVLDSHLRFLRDRNH